MKLTEYRPEHFEALRKAATRVGPNVGLTHRPFVDYYYGSRDWCKLYLFVDEQETVQGVIGVDRMRFEYCGREMLLGFATNFYAFQHGVGGYLYLQ